MKTATTRIVTFVATVSANGLAALGCGERPPSVPTTATADGVTTGTPPRCPRTAAPDRDGRCACPAGDATILGACATPREADAFCGPLARWVDGGCRARACGEGGEQGEQGERELALTDAGACVPTRTQCPSGSRPFATRPASIRVASAAQCLPVELFCPRTAERAAGDCPSARRCPAGAVAWPGTASGASGRDGATIPNDGRGRCAPLAGPSPAQAGGSGAALDLGTWVAAAFGSSGGTGTWLYCAPLVLAMAQLAPAGPRELELVVDVRVPGNEAGDAFARVTPVTSTGHGGGAPPDTLVATAAREAELLVAALRRAGGMTTAARAVARVRCAVPGATPVPQGSDGSTEKWGRSSGDDRGVGVGAEDDADTDADDADP